VASLVRYKNYLSRIRPKAADEFLTYVGHRTGGLWSDRSAYIWLLSWPLQNIYAWTWPWGFRGLPSLQKDVDDGLGWYVQVDNLQVKFEILCSSLSWVCTYLGEAVDMGKVGDNSQSAKDAVLYLTFCSCNIMGLIMSSRSFLKSG